MILVCRKVQEIILSSDISYFVFLISNEFSGLFCLTIGLTIFISTQNLHSFEIEKNDFEASQLPR